MNPHNPPEENAKEQSRFEQDNIHYEFPFHQYNGIVDQPVYP